GRSPEDRDRGPPHHERPRRRDRSHEGARPRPHADQPALQDRQHLRAEADQERVPARDPARGREQREDPPGRGHAEEEAEGAREEALVLSSAPMPALRLAVAILAWGAPGCGAKAQPPPTAAA